jgi:hypothetical protein
VLKAIDAAANGSACGGAPDPAGFASGLNPNGRKIIRALAKAHPDALSTEDVAKATGIEAAKLGPIFKHVYAVAARSGLEKDDVIEFVQDPDEPAWKHRYRLRDGIKSAVQVHHSLKDV